MAKNKREKRTRHILAGPFSEAKSKRAVEWSEDHAFAGQFSVAKSRRDEKRSEDHALAGQFSVAKSRRDEKWSEGPRPRRPVFCGQEQASEEEKAHTRSESSKRNCARRESSSHWNVT